MDQNAIALIIREHFPESVTGVQEFRGQVSVLVKGNAVRDILRFLHDTTGLSFDYLIDLCGADYLNFREPRYEVVYHLHSMENDHRIRIRAALDDKIPEIDTVSDIYETANWHERECFDMYGIVFREHPDLRRVLMPEDWEGHPQRKDYPVRGPKIPWHGFREVLEKAERYKQYEIKDIG